MPLPSARRDGSTSRCRISALASCGLEGCSYETWRVHGLGDTGQAVVSNCYRVPLDEEPEVLNGLRSLETPGYFEGCKDREGGGAQLDCLFGGLKGGSAITCP